MTASIIGAGLNLLLNWIFIRIYGYYAAGYTTLFCYIIFALGHYYFMSRICREKMDGLKVYNTKLLLLMSVVFVFAGFAMMGTYNYPIVRYGIILIALIIAFAQHKRIMNVFNSFMSLRKKG